jgi:translation elongation factor EF-Tu-like GTPase
MIFSKGGNYMSVETKDIRNVAIIGHNGTGKTNLIEQILFYSGALSKAEKVESGKTIPKVEESVQEGSTSTTVYITKTGKRYHCTPDCPGLSNANAIYRTTLTSAKSKGLTPCQKCY